jgi:O-antigen/teichoic acid export membrane protein
MSESFWILLVCLVALFVFELALGAYSPGQVIGLSIVMAVLFVLWIAHAAWTTRRAEKRDPRAVAARERRGF